MTATGLSATQILDREFLEMRAKILELAAALDRLERADGSVEGDPRLEKLRAGVKLLEGSGPGRAEQVQILFSREFEDDWRRQFGV